MTRHYAQPAKISLTSMRANLSRQSGMTLLELLIAMSLGLLLVVGIGTIFVGSNQTYRVQEENARLQEAGRFALEAIGRSVRQAGFVNFPVNPTSLVFQFGGTPITGNANSVTVQYDCPGPNDCGCGIGSAGTAAFQEALDLAVDADGVLNLRCNTQPLVANVQALQFLYGVDNTGDQSANFYTAAPADWNRVVSARVCIVISSTNQGIATGNQRFLNCAGALGTAAAGTEFTLAGDTRLRRTFVATFNLRNRINRIP